MGGSGSALKWTTVSAPMIGRRRPGPRHGRSAQRSR